MNSCYIDSPIGKLYISEENNKIVRISASCTDDNLCGQPTNNILLQAKTEFDEYFSGKRKNFTVPICFNGTPFQNKVWRALLNIPYSETRSYMDIAEVIGNAKAVRAVGNAIHKNPIMIVIPCHRVVGRRGDLVGYAYGLDMKKFLLDLES